MTTPPPQPWYRSTVRFSLAQLVVWIAIIALVVSNYNMRQEIARLRESQVEEELPMLTLDDVAEQFLKETAKAPHKVTVKDVRYSESEDAYKIYYAWEDAETKQSHGGSVEFKGKGNFGKYYGYIRNKRFVEGMKRPYLQMEIRAPSRYKKQSEAD